VMTCDFTYLVNANYTNNNILSTSSKFEYSKRNNKVAEIHVIIDSYHKLTTFVGYHVL